MYKSKSLRNRLFYDYPVRTSIYLQVLINAISIAEVKVFNGHVMQKEQV